MCLSFRFRVTSGNVRIREKFLVDIVLNLKCIDKKMGLTYKGWKFIKTGTIVQVAIELASCHYKKIYTV